MKKIISKKNQSMDSEQNKKSEKNITLTQTEKTQNTETKKKNYLNLAKKVARFLDDKKMKDILVLDVREKCDIADFFIIATGNSTTHISTVPSYIKSELLKLNIVSLRREGVVRDTKWSVLDYGFMIIHIFLGEMRDEYKLEEVWHFAKQVKWEVKSIEE